MIIKKELRFRLPQLLNLVSENNYSMYIMYLFVGVLYRQIISTGSAPIVEIDVDADFS